MYSLRFIEVKIALNGFEDICENENVKMP